MIKQLRESSPRLPIIVCSRVPAALGLQAIKDGATDFVDKSPSGILALPDAVRSALESARGATVTAAPSSRQAVEELLEASTIGTFSVDESGGLESASDAFLKIVGSPSLAAACGKQLQELLEVDPKVLNRRGVVHQEVLTRPQDGNQGVRARLTYAKREPSNPQSVVRSDQLGPGAGLLQNLEVGPVSYTSALATPASNLLSSNLPSGTPTSDPISAVLAHELREPIRMIEKYTQLLADEYGGSLGAEGSQYMGYALDGAKRLSSVVDNLLLLNRSIESGELSPVPCEEIVEGVLVQLNEQLESLGAGVHLDPLPTVRANRTQLEIVFRNLIENALKFRGSETPRIWISAKQRQDEWVISVRDNGVGLEEAERATIFEGFKRLQPEMPGSGLGLTICRRILEHHRGRIWVESQPGHGSTFSFSLPLAGNVSRLDPNRRPRGLRTASQ